VRQLEGRSSVQRDVSPGRKPSSRRRDVLFHVTVTERVSGFIPTFKPTFNHSRPTQNEQNSEAYCFEQGVLLQTPGDRRQVPLAGSRAPKRVRRLEERSSVQARFIPTFKPNFKHSRPNEKNSRISVRAANVTLRPSRRAFRPWSRPQTEEKLRVVFPIFFNA
jgi:hypothetical protein